MPRVTFTHGSDDTALTQAERRRFERLARALRATDPAWLARHYPRRRRHARLARGGVAVVALTLVIVGALTGTMPVVFAGILLASADATSLVSSRSKPRADRRGGSRRHGAAGRQAD